MSLTELWLTSRHQVEEKSIQQIIAFSGDGKLGDNRDASREFREYLSIIPTEFLRTYVEQCLSESFKDSGLVLQDIVNEVGRRLGLQVVNGRYRGVTGQNGFDGLWHLPEKHSFVVEVKTTDAFRLDLNTVAHYRKELINAQDISELQSSILIVVGRHDTGDLEAQIRGSRHAWDIRLISVDALLRLMELKQEVEDSRIVQRMYDLLIPREFTKLDEIVEIVFSTAEEVKFNETRDIAVEDAIPATRIDASVTTECVMRVERKLGISLVRRSRVSYATPDDSVALVCLVSKVYANRGTSARYWFGYRISHKYLLDSAKQGFIALGCGTPENLILLPSQEFHKYLQDLNTSEDENRMYWHIHVIVTSGQYLLTRKGGLKSIDITQYLMSRS